MNFKSSLKELPYFSEKITEDNLLRPYFAQGSKGEGIDTAVWKHDPKFPLDPFSHMPYPRDSYFNLESPSAHERVPLNS